MMNVERLLKLADLLEADAANPEGTRFDLNCWGYSIGEPGPDCGTYACAVGLACLSGAFKDEGLSFSRDGTGIMPQYRHNQGWDAVEDFFGLSGAVVATDVGDILPVSFLFSANFYKVVSGREAELAVAHRIRDFVQSKTELMEDSFYLLHPLLVDKKR